MSFDVINWLFAILPILVLLILLLYFRRGGDEAASVSLLCACFTAYFVFGGSFDMLASAIAKAMWTSISIVFIIFPALIIYEVSRESGAFSVIREGMQAFTPDKVLQVLAVGWIFNGFLQGITGFGVSVVVCAPLLVGMGVKPMNAVVISLLGQAWGNTFGTLGIAWDGLASQADLSDPIIYRQTILWATAMLGVLNMFAGFGIAALAGGYNGVKRNVVLLISFSLVQGLGQMVVAMANTMLCNFIVVSLSLGAIFAVGKIKYYRQHVELHDAIQPPATKENTDSCSMTIKEAFIPYAFLIVLAVFVLLIPSVKNFLGQWQLSLAFSEKSTSLGFVTPAYKAYSPLSPLIHSGLFLLLAAIVGYLCYAKRGYIQAGGSQRIFTNALGKTIPSAIAVVGLIAMSKVMDDTGQTTTLAKGVVAMTGSYYPLLSPFIGLLGTFMTASNLSSNILFSNFQQQVAEMLNIGKSQLLAAQTSGAAVGSLISPSKILLGTSSVNIMGREGEVIGKVIVGALSLCLLFGLLVLFSY